MIRTLHSAPFAHLSSQKAPYDYVYCAFHPETELYKIGKTDSLGNRIRALASDFPGVILVHFIRTNHGHRLERHLHKLYAPARKHGEWFDLSPDQLYHFRLLSWVKWKL